MGGEDNGVSGRCPPRSSSALPARWACGRVHRLHLSRRDGDWEQHPSSQALLEGASAAPVLTGDYSNATWKPLKSCFKAPHSFRFFPRIDV